MEGEEPTKKIKTEENDALSKIKKFTKIVADTGEFSQIKQFSPEDATTNPSLILKAAALEEYRPVFLEAIEYGKKNLQKYKIESRPVQSRRSTRKSTGKSATKSKPSEMEEEEQKKPEPEFNYAELSQEDKTLLIQLIVDKLAVAFGKKILELIPGVVSSEVDARLSYDKQATVARAKRIIQMYEEEGIGKDRVLIKIASTWEGIEAAKALKKEKILCNMTLIFGYEQAIACGDAGVHLISPFVGRIYDWYKKRNPEKDHERHNCPGVKSVTSIYNYFKKFGISTIVMGASFRNTGQILELSGCDKLTISPKLLQQLAEDKESEVKQQLNPENVNDMDIKQISMDEKVFRWAQNQDECMSELLPAGIRSFAADIEKLEVLIEKELSSEEKKDEKEEEKKDEKEEEKKPEAEAEGAGEEEKK